GSHTATACPAAVRGSPASSYVLLGGQPVSVAVDDGATLPQQQSGAAGLRRGLRAPRSDARGSARANPRHQLPGCATEQDPRLALIGNSTLRGPRELRSDPAMGHNDPSGRVASRTSLAANPPISAGMIGETPTHALLQWFRGGSGVVSGPGTRPDPRS